VSNRRTEWAMSGSMRHLTLLALVACSSVSGSAEPQNNHLDGWLERWDRARSCLVEGGGNTRNGVAISTVLGRDCTAFVAAVEEPPGDDPLWSYTRVLVGELSTTSIEQRALVVDQIDANLSARPRTRRLIIPGEPPRVLDGYRPRWLEEAHRVTFNAGAIHTEHRYCDEHVTGSDRSDHPCWLHHPLERPVYPSGTWFPDAVVIKGETISRQLAAADDGAFRLILALDDEEAAYVAWLSSDAGRTWRRTAAPAGTRVVAYWQEPGSGRIDVIVRDLDDVYRHRISPRGQIQMSRIYARRSWDFPLGLEISCRHGEVAWSVVGNDVIEIGDHVRRWHLNGFGRGADVDCRGDTAIVLRHGPDVIERCGAGCNSVFAPKFDGRGVAALADDQTWVYALAVDRVVAVWREGRRGVELYQLAEPGELQALSVLGGEAWLVTKDWRIFRL